MVVGLYLEGEDVYIYPKNNLVSDCLLKVLKIIVENPNEKFDFTYWATPNSSLANFEYYTASEMKEIIAEELRDKAWKNWDEDMGIDEEEYDDFMNKTPNIIQHIIENGWAEDEDTDKSWKIEKTK